VAAQGEGGGGGFGAEDGWRVVGAAVVDIDDLVGDGGQRGADFGNERGDVGGFVAHRDDDRKEWRGRGLHGVWAVAPWRLWGKAAARLVLAAATMER